MSEKVIWKFPIKVTDYVTVSMPVNAKILSFQETTVFNFSTLNVWALVDPEAPVEDRYFRMCGTGRTIKDSDCKTYVGTCVTKSGFVWHLFEK